MAEGLVTPGHARGAYGVVLTEGDSPSDAPRVDAAATEGLRAELRGARLGRGPLPAAPAATLPEGHRWLDTNVTLSPDDAASCGRCGHHLADAGQSYKTGLRMIETDLADTDRVWHDPTMYCDDVDLVFREFVCPGCATLIEVEMTFRDEPALEDKQLTPQRTAGKG